MKVSVSLSSAAQETLWNVVLSALTPTVTHSHPFCAATSCETALSGVAIEVLAAMEDAPGYPKDGLRCVHSQQNLACAFLRHCYYQNIRHYF